jgi:hypothetical protein
MIIMRGNITAQKYNTKSLIPRSSLPLLDVIVRITALGARRPVATNNETYLAISCLLGGRPEQQCSSNIGNLRLKLAIIRYNLHKGKIAYQLWQRIPSICQMQYGAT